MDIVTFDQFAAVELRAGTVARAENFPEARKPAIKLWVDFGPDIGVKQTSAQITAHYEPQKLIGKQVIGCLNLGPKRIAGFMSEFLCVGLPDAAGAVVLIAPDRPVPNGAKLF